MKTSGERTAALLSALWQRNLPLVEERLGELERAARAASEGRLEEEQREAAGETAHKLAGALGMYGFPHGTRVARQVELMLDYPTPNGAELAARVAELRNALFPE